MKCVRCPKDKKKEAEFVYIGCSYCRDCYYVRLEEIKEKELKYCEIAEARIKAIPQKLL